MQLLAYSGWLPVCLGEKPIQYTQDKTKKTCEFPAADTYRFDVQQDGWFSDEGGFFGLFGGVFLQPLLFQSLGLLIHLFIAAEQIDVILILVFLLLFHRSGRGFLRSGGTGAVNGRRCRPLLQHWHTTLYLTESRMQLLHHWETQPEQLSKWLQKIRQDVNKWQLICKYYDIITAVQFEWWICYIICPPPDVQYYVLFYIRFATIKSNAWD